MSAEDKGPKHKLKAATHHFRGGMKNLFEVRGYIEFDKYGFRPLVQLSIFSDFKRDEDHSVTMQLDSYGLREFIYMLKIRHKVEKEMKIITGGSGSIKTMFINFESHNYFINISVKDKTFKVSFDLGQMQAIIQTLSLLADNIERKAVDFELEKSMNDFKAPFNARHLKEEKEKEVALHAQQESVISLLQTIAGVSGGVALSSDEDITVVPVSQGSAVS